ncbi:MAG: hypothetical protein LBU99_05220 [Spirochaetaceae bacterium]|jgi:hypothetical protein|nr:hypothetical protein [Spirochaetaceae bacterium]
MLKDGGSVFVRVLEKSGSDAVVSLNGVRIQVSSELDLKSGDNFRAEIRIRNNTLYLHPLVENVGAAALSDEAAQFFARTGLPADGISLRLVQLFQQLGVGVHTENAEKARRLAARFPGRESEAAEAALQLLEKGIEPFPSDIAGLLLSMQGGDVYQDADSGFDRESSEEEEPEILKRIYDRFSELDRTPGVLTLFNHLNGSSSDRRNHWIVLPYNIEIGGNETRGALAFLVDTVEQKTLRVSVSAESAGERWLFYLLIGESHNGGRKIEFCRFPPIPNDERDLVIKRFVKILSLQETTAFLQDVTVCYVQKKDEDSLFSVDDEFDGNELFSGNQRFSGINLEI